jgi:aspartate aminotransferase
MSFYHEMKSVKNGILFSLSNFLSFIDLQRYFIGKICFGGNRMKISSRGAQMPPSPIRKLVPYSIEAEKRGIEVFHLNIGQPDIETPRSFWNAVHSYPAKVLEYGNSQGLPEFRDQLVKYYERYNILVGASEMVVTTGGSEAIMFAMLAVTDPGDNIIVFEPFYTNYNGYAMMTDITLKPIKTDPEDGFHLPPADIIEKAIDSKTRAFLICSPNNPTGTVLTREEVETIAAIAAKHDIYVIADEVYREFTYEGEHTSIMHIPTLDQRGIMVDSISKRFSACGGRIGNVISKNKDILSAMLRMGQARLCPPTIEQYAAQAVLMQLDDKYFPPRRRIPPTTRRHLRRTDENPRRCMQKTVGRILHHGKTTRSRRRRFCQIFIDRLFPQPKNRDGCARSRLLCNTRSR